MTLRNFFIGRTVVFGILLIIGFVIFAYKAYSPTPQKTGPVTQVSSTSTPPTFVWKYEQATSLNLDGIPKTNIFLEATYSNAVVERKLVDTTPSSCNALPDSEKDSLASTTNIQCYGAGIGYRFKITKGQTSYLVQRKTFEEASPNYTPPTYKYEVIAEFPFTKPQYKIVTRDFYSFEVPKEWTATTPQDVKGCRWDGAVNIGSDGHRQNGEIGIYQKSCFDLSKSLGKKEVAEKDGYYIVAYYDKESGTTDTEIAQTKTAHQQIVSTFSVK